MSSSFYLTSDPVTRLENPKNLFAESNKEINSQVQLKTVGQGQHSNRGSGARADYKKFSPDVKGLIGALGQLGTCKEVGKQFDIAPTTVSNYANGKTACGKYTDPEVKTKLEDRLSDVRGQGVTLLQEVLSRVLDPSRLNDASFKELSGILSNAASVVDKLGPKGQFNVTNQVGVMIFSPKIKQEEDYEVIEAEAIRLS